MILLASAELSTRAVVGDASVTINDVFPAGRRTPVHDRELGCTRL
jgi:hypothetical protein